MLIYIPVPALHAHLELGCCNFFRFFKSYLLKCHQCGLWRFPQERAWGKNGPFAITRVLKKFNCLQSSRISNPITSLNKPAQITNINNIITNEPNEAYPTQQNLNDEEISEDFKSGSEPDTPGDENLSCDERSRATQMKSDQSPVLLQETDHDVCDLTILPVEAFYPVYWTNYKHLFSHFSSYYKIYDFCNTSNSFAQVPANDAHNITYYNNKNQNDDSRNSSNNINNKNNTDYLIYTNEKRNAAYSTDETLQNLVNINIVVYISNFYINDHRINN